MITEHIACLLLAASVSLSAQEGGPSTGEPPISQQISRAASSLLSGDPQLKGKCRFDSLDKRVLIDWTLTPLFDGSEPQETTNWVISRSTAFWPTAAVPIDGSRIAVAGKARNGDTLIEIWTVDSPSYTLAIAPDGTVKPKLVGGGVNSVEEVARHSVPGRVGVYAIMPLLSSADQAIVQYGDSMDWYRVDWSDEVTTETMVFDSSAEPLLGEPWDFAIWGDSETTGYVYTLYSADLPHVYFMDSDRDGHFDGHGVATPAVTSTYFNGDWISFMNEPSGS